MIDGEDGENPAEEAGVAGTSADGPNPETAVEGAASAVPPKVNVADDLKKEKIIERNVDTAEPESDAGQATGGSVKEEL